MLLARFAMDSVKIFQVRHANASFHAPLIVQHMGALVVCAEELSSCFGA